MVSHREPSPAAAKRQRVTASKLHVPYADFFFLKKKIQYFFKPSWGGPGGVWGVSWGSGRPVWLRNAHRWSSWEYPRRPDLASDPFVEKNTFFPTLLGRPGGV